MHLKPLADSGTEVKVDGEEYLILSERDILAIVE
jgi:co-chaperonin GroES (HSP10)